MENRFDMFERSSILLATLLITSVPELALAQKVSCRPLTATLLTYSEYKRDDASREDYFKSLVAKFRSLRTDGTLRAADLATLEASGDAFHRAGIIARLLEMDVDGDGSVTENEMRVSFQTRIECSVANPDAAVQSYMAADNDGNGTVSLGEANNYAKRSDALYSTGRAANLARLLEFDRDHDGNLAEAELRAAASDEFDRFDTDRDGLLSLPEKVAIGEHRECHRHHPFDMPPYGQPFGDPFPNAAYSCFFGTTKF